MTGTATIAAVLTDRLTAKTAAVRWDNRGRLSDARVTFLPLRFALFRAGRAWLAFLKEGVAQPPSSPIGSVPVKGVTETLRAFPLRVTKEPYLWSGAGVKHSIDELSVPKLEMGRPERPYVPGKAPTKPVRVVV